MRIDQSYRRRIAELQARYRLVSAKGPFWYSCDGDPRNEVVVTFFKTDPPTLEAERGDQVSLMYLESRPEAVRSIKDETNRCGNTRVRRRLSGDTAVQRFIA